MRDHSHKPDERDGETVHEGAEEQALLCRLLTLCSKGALPHFRTRQRKHKICNNVSDDIAIDIGSCQLRREIAEKGGRSAEFQERCAGNQDIDKQNQHDELEHIRVDHAEQS